MPILLPKTRHELTLFSTSELTRHLNIPESRMLKAIRDGVIRPLGRLGSMTLIALGEDEVDDLRRILASPSEGKAGRIG
jgi:hypothetical protein